MRTVRILAGDPTCDSVNLDQATFRLNRCGAPGVWVLMLGDRRLATGISCDRPDHLGDLEQILHDFGDRGLEIANIERGETS